MVVRVMTRRKVPGQDCELTDGANAVMILTTYKSDAHPRRPARGGVNGVKRGVHAVPLLVRDWVGGRKREGCQRQLVMRRDNGGLPRRAAARSSRPGCRARSTSCPGACETTCSIVGERIFQIQSGMVR